MKNTSSVISTYAADTMGVASALFELGGMVIMHDASGCNSTYSTHDEPRWYNTDSMVYISALTEIDAIMGNDEKLICDIVSTANELHPKFIAVAGTPIPMVIGTDYDALQKEIEKRTKIPTVCIATTGMNTYIKGADAAFCKIAERFVAPKEQSIKNATGNLTVNILGATPLDFYLNGAIEELENELIKCGISVQCNLSLGGSLKQLCSAANANVNLVISASGAGTAEFLRQQYGIPSVFANPTGADFKALAINSIFEAAKTGKSTAVYKEFCTGIIGDIAVIGEQIAAQSLAAAITLESGHAAFAVCPTDCDPKLNSGGIKNVFDEDEIKEAVSHAKVVVADPLFKPIINPKTHFIANPHSAFSGRIFNNSSINPISGFEKIKGDILL